MNKKSYGLVIGVAGIAAVVGGLIAYTPASQAETIWEITPASAQTGMHLRIGECPCFRWQIQVQAGSGRYETEDVLVSSRALFEYTQTNSVGFQDVAAQIFKAGQVEAYSKEGHVGVGFNGVQWGKDPDRGYKSLFRTGAYALINLIGTNGLISQNDEISVDGHLGYNWDQFTNLLGVEKSRGLVDGAVALKFDSGPFRGGASAHVGIDTSHIDMSHAVIGAEAYARARLVSFSDFELGLSGKVELEHDGFRKEELGLTPNALITSLLMDISWVERDHTN